MRIRQVATPDYLTKRMENILEKLDEKCFPDDQPEEKANTYWWIAYQDQKPVGFVGYRYIRNLATLVRIGVIREYREQGFANRLLGTIIRHSIRNGCERIYATTIWSNIGSINLLIKHGFKAYRADDSHEEDYFLIWQRSEVY